MRAWGEPPWRRVAVPTRPIASSSPEVAIVGGGFTGMAAAWHLARRRIGVVVLEADAIGEGASGRTGGLVLEGTAWGAKQDADRCVPALKQLAEEAALDCDLHLPGCWEIAHGDGGPSGEMLPWRDDNRGVHIVRALAGGTVEPMKLVTQLARAAAGAGAIIHEHTRVLRIATEPRLAIELDSAVIEPQFAIMAVNAWTSDLLPDVRPLQSALTFACATEPLSESTRAQIGLAAGIPFYTVDTPYLWGRSIDDGRVIFGSGLTYDTGERLERLAIDAAAPAAALARLEARVRGLHPALAEVRITHRWGGPIAIPRGGAPLVGVHPRASRLLVAGGYAGHGVALGPWLGRLMARSIAEGTPLPAWGEL